MRTDFSPTAQAARLLALRGSASRTVPTAPAVAEERWCEWPRRAPAPRRIVGLWRALQEIQARHA